MTLRLIALAILATLSACQQEAPAASQASTSGQTDCARDCLESTIENYLQALAAQDPALIEVSDKLLFSENNQMLKLGEGSWQTMTGTGSYRHYFADPQTQQVAVISTMRENGKGVIYDLRLRLEDRKIAEIESLVIRTQAGADLYEKLYAEHDGPPPNFQHIIPEAERNTREELLMLPYQYLNGMENNDPNGDYSFFAPDCNRYEHALKTTNNEPMNVGHTESTTFSTMTCAAQFSGGGLAFVTRIRDERYISRMVVDEEKQAVFGFVFLDHNGTVHSITRPDGSESAIPPYFSSPRGLTVGEAWRVRDKQLLEIEMTLIEMPYGERPNFGLEGEDQRWLRAENINPDNLRVAANCQQQCLDQLSEDFLTALVSHDYSRLPLSRTVHYRENGQPLAVGDGLWGSATELQDYQVFLSNPETQKAGFFGTIIERDVPGLLSARLQIENGLIQDIDVTVMRHEFNTARGGTLSLFYPQIDGMFSPEQFKQPDPVFSQVATADVNDIVAQVSQLNAGKRESVMLLADARRGLVLQQSIEDISNASAAPVDSSSSGAYSVLTTSLYKFNENTLVQEKSVKRSMPYKMPL